jgi:hypothetical protein
MKQENLDRLRKKAKYKKLKNRGFAERNMSNSKIGDFT